MRSHWSLVAFTLLLQSVVGSVWCMQFALFSDDVQIELFYFKYHIVVALGLVLAGLAAAVSHLGTPLASFNAIRNIGHSWLSREIVTVNLFASVLAIMTVSAFIDPTTLKPWLVLAGSSAGGMVIYSMTRVYLLRTVPYWDHAGTSLTFLGSTLLLGAVLFTVVLNLFTLIVNIGPGAMQIAIHWEPAYIIALAGLAFKVLAAGKFPFEKEGHTGHIKRMLPVMQTIGIALWAVSMLPSGRPGIYFVLFYLAAVILVAGEIVDRIQFYNNYYRVGL